MNHTTDIPVERILSDELAHGDALLGTIVPILGHLVISPSNSFFSDEIVAQVRGMADSVASQLLTEQAKAGGKCNVTDFVESGREDLAARLLANDGFLSHCHALTIERQFAERLLDRSAIDPVLSPMLQAMISSDDAATASNAMAVLTAQARYLQHQRRMELPVSELPGDLFHAIVLEWRTGAGEGTEDVTAQAEMQLRARYDESTSRLGLLSRLVTGMGQGMRAALSVSHAGAALFLTALALGSKQYRDIAVFSTNDRQLGRFALALRASGLKSQEVEEQFLLVHPDISLPEGFEMLRSDRAAEMLASSIGRPGS